MIMPIHTEKSKLLVQQGHQAQQLFVAGDDAPVFAVGDSFGFWHFETQFETCAPIPFGRNKNFPFGFEKITSIHDVKLKRSNNKLFLFLDSTRMNPTECTSFCKASGFDSMHALFNYYLPTKYNNNPNRDIALICYGWN